MQILKTWFKVAIVTLALISLTSCGPRQSGSESLRAGSALQDAGSAEALKSGVSGMSRPEVVARAQAAHASAALWVTSGGGRRCFYIEVVNAGSGPEGSSSCVADSASQCTINRLSGFIFGIVPSGWTGALAISTGGTPIETVALNKGYFLTSNAILLPNGPLTLSSVPGSRNSESCTATLR